MEKSCFSLFYLFLLSALLLAFSWELGAQDFSGTEGRQTQSSEAALNRLVEISNQLSNLNERLREELQDSRQSSRELQTRLEASRRELEALREELAILQSSSMQLLIRAENSQTELTELLSALRKAESSLMSLEVSFAAYRETAEGRINTLTKQNRLWKWGCIAASVLAAGFGGAFLLGR